jgi:hypothetical protein
MGGHEPPHVGPGATALRTRWHCSALLHRIARRSRP